MFTFRNVRILFAAALLAAIFCLAGCSTAAQAVPQPAETSRSAEATPETAAPAPTSTPAPTATPEPTPAPDTVVESTYVASRKAKKYHRPSCQYAAKIKDENLVSFDSAAQAQAAGYASCGACKP